MQYKKGKVSAIKEVTALKRIIFMVISIFAVMLPAFAMRDSDTQAEQALPVCSVEFLKKAEAAENTQYNNKIDSTLEDYVVGVVAGEMPVNFPHEALKAQAVAARTYALRQLNEDPSLSYDDIAQAHTDIERMHSMWGKSFDENYNKIKNAVYSTAGEILEYDNKPILAVFCSTTNGHTEECENVWTQDIPYLSSVESEGDKYSPYFEDSLTLSKEKFKAIFGSEDIGEVKKSPAGYVLNIKIGGREYTGAGVRSLLGLRSASFDIQKNADGFTINTRGYGHGVGMSQYGACYMANNGADYRTILGHYYKSAIIKKL